MENFTDPLIKSIEKADWFKTMDDYPKTLNHMKLFIVIIDKMNVFANINLDNIHEMDAKRLNLIYAILRITNTIFNNYLIKTTESLFK